MNGKTFGILAAISAASFGAGWCASNGYYNLKLKRKKAELKKKQKKKEPEQESEKLPEVKMTPATPNVFAERQLEMDLEEKAEEISEKAGYSEKTEAKKRSVKPYIIEEDEYDNNTIFKKSELTLYLGDGVVTDENDDEVNNWKSLVGVEALRQLETFGERVVFVRNEDEFTDFMIAACDGSYGGDDND